MHDLKNYVRQGTAARILGLSRQRVAELDAELMPETTGDGLKLYRLDRVHLAAGARRGEKDWRGDTRRALIRLVRAEAAR